MLVCAWADQYFSPAYPTPSLPFTLAHRPPSPLTSRTLPQRARGQPLSGQTFEQLQGACVVVCLEATSLRPASPAPSPRPRVRAVARCRLSYFKDIFFHFPVSTQWQLREPWLPDSPSPPGSHGCQTVHPPLVSSSKRAKHQELPARRRGRRTCAAMWSGVRPRPSSGQMAAWYSMRQRTTSQLPLCAA